MQHLKTPTTINCSNSIILLHTTLQTHNSALTVLTSQNLCTTILVRPSSSCPFNNLHICDTPPGLKLCEKARHKWRWYFHSESAVIQQSSEAARLPHKPPKRMEKGEQLPRCSFFYWNRRAKLIQIKKVYSPNGSSILELTCVFTLTMSSSASCQQYVLNPLFPVSPYGVKCWSLAQGAVVWEGCCWCKVRPVLLLLSYWFS